MIGKYINKSYPILQTTLSVLAYKKLDKVIRRDATFIKVRFKKITIFNFCSKFVIGLITSQYATKILTAHF